MSCLKNKFFQFQPCYVSLACRIDQSFCNTLCVSRATKLNLESFVCAKQYAHVSRSSKIY